MRKQDFALVLEEVTSKLYALTASKGEEYSGQDNDDQFANFKRQATLLGLDPRTVWAVYFNKHVDSINNYLRAVANKQTPVLSEPITGRIDDAILYLVLLRGLVEELEGCVDPSCASRGATHTHPRGAFVVTGKDIRRRHAQD